MELLQLSFSALPRLVSALELSSLVTALESPLVLPLVPALESPLNLALESLPLVPALELPLVSLLVPSPFLASPGLCWRGRWWRLGRVASRPWWMSRQFVSLPLESSLVPALELPLCLALELLLLLILVAALELPQVLALELL